MAKKKTKQSYTQTILAIKKLGYISSILIVISFCAIPFVSNLLCEAVVKCGFIDFFPTLVAFGLLVSFTVILIAAGIADLVIKQRKKYKQRAL